MTHIELEAKLPDLYKAENLDHPENRSAEYYQDKLFHEFSPDYYENEHLQGHGHNLGVKIQKITRKWFRNMGHNQMNRDGRFIFTHILGKDEDYPIFT